MQQCVRRWNVQMGDIIKSHGLTLTKIVCQDGAAPCCIVIRTLRPETSRETSPKITLREMRLISSTLSMSEGLGKKVKNVKTICAYPCIKFSNVAKSFQFLRLNQCHEQLKPTPFLEKIVILTRSAQCLQW